MIASASLNPSGPSISIIVPTYHEAKNLPELINRLGKVRDANALELEVLIVDDDSQDGTDQVVAALDKPWVRLIIRTRDRGLSAAVLEGFRQARNDLLMIMDADLSHPPEKIPEMVDALIAGADFVIGSRYVQGGSTDEAWGILRWINSRAATLLARPFTATKDPMSGFIALRRETFQRASVLSPIGYKIGLELLVKCGCQQVAEVPIHFSQRQHGESKLSLQEQLRYLEHLRRLFVFKYGNWAHFGQFALVGFSGTLVNLAVLTVLHLCHVPLKISVAIAIFISMLSNFILNRQFTFSYAREGSPWFQLVGFLAANSVGTVVNYFTTLGTLALWPILVRTPQAASLIGIVAGLSFNYVASRYLVFIKPRV